MTRSLCLASLLLSACAGRHAPPEAAGEAQIAFEDIAGPWCLGGQPACTYDVREDGVWQDATGAVHPYTLEGDVWIIDPGDEVETRWQILGVYEDDISARLLSTGDVFLFSRAAGESVVPEIPFELEDGFEVIWAERAVLYAAAPWCLNADDGWRDGEAPGHPETLVVVVAGESALRVVAEQDGVRAAAWIAREGFERRVGRPSVLGGGVTALGGAPLASAEPLGDGRVRVEIVEGGLTVTGEVKESAIDEVFTPAPAADPGFSWAFVGDAVSLYGGDGAEIATIDTTAWGYWIESAAPDEVDGRRPVVVRTEHLVVSGWVDAAQIRSVEEGLRGLGTFGQGMWFATHTSQVRVPPGTPLRHPETGDVVALALEGAYLRASWGAEGPDLPVRARMPWGYLSLTADCPSLDTSGEDWVCE